MATTLKKNEKGKFFSYSWSIDEKETDKTIIRIYGLNEKNESTCIIVNDFTPYMYLQLLPENINWNEKSNLVINKISEYIREKEKEPISYQLLYRKKLYFANLEKNGEKKKYPFLFCNFHHTEHIKYLCARLRKPLMIPGIGTVTIKPHENNASPILQLTSRQKIPTAGWINFQGEKKEEEEKLTDCQNEYIVSWKKLTPDETLNTVARPLLMGYDIEVYSSNPSSMPKSGNPSDKIFQISCVFARQGDLKTMEKYLISLGKPDNKTLGDDIICIECRTEADLLLSFTELIKKKQPNIIIGYNIFTFDIPYMIDRAKLTYVYGEFSKQGMDKFGYAKEKTIEWSSSAYKNQSFQFLDVEGRIFVDLLPLVKRDYKMNNYKLKTIASHFLKDMTKDPLDARGIFKCYELGMKDIKKGPKALSIVGKYCVKDSELVVRLFEKLTSWIALCEMSKLTNVPIFSLYTQGQQLKVFSQVYKKCTHDLTILERDGYITKDDDFYTGATVFPPIPGVYNRVVPFDFSSLYPSTIIAYNISWDTLVLDDSIPDEKCHIMSWEDHIGCVHCPTEIRKKELLEILKKHDDIIKEYRIKRDSTKNKEIKNEMKMLIEEIKQKMKPYREERSNLAKSKPKNIICSKRNFRWLKNPTGVLPEILINLLEARKKTKKEMNLVKQKLKDFSEGSDEWFETYTYIDILDQRQLALKVSANSAYGCLGVRRGYLPFMPGAMCTTFKGRQAIQEAANAIINTWNGVLVYGDTDSNYVNFPHCNSVEEVWDYSVKVAQKVSELFPKPMSLAFEEKVYERFLILTKKRYICLEAEKDGRLKTDGNGKTAISKKGVLLQRRDNSSFIRKVYADMIMKIFDRVDRDLIFYFLIQEINKLFSRFYHIQDFIITKSVGDFNINTDEDGNIIFIDSVDKKGQPSKKIGDYVVKLLSNDPKKRKEQLSKKNTSDHFEYYSRCLPAQAQLAQKMKNRGQIVSSGSRIEYLITTNGGHNANQYEKIESAEYFQKHSGILQIDFLYYLKQLASPIDQILDIIFKNNNDYKYKYKSDFLYSQYKFRLNKSKMLDQLRAIFKPKIIFSD